jgi:hypothetical protein
MGLTAGAGIRVLLLFPAAMRLLSSIFVYSTFDY